MKNYALVLQQVGDRYWMIQRGAESLVEDPESDLLYWKRTSRLTAADRCSWTFREVGRLLKRLPE